MTDDALEIATDHVLSDIERAREDRAADIARRYMARLGAEPLMALAWDGDKVSFGADASEAIQTEMALSDALGTGNHAFMDDQALALAHIVDPSPGKASPRLESAFAIVRAAHARNELEGALAVQIAATHALALDRLSRAAGAGDDRQADADLGEAVKLQASLVALVDALGRAKALPTEGVMNGEG
jgi:hypothetical protein